MHLERARVLACLKNQSSTAFQRYVAPHISLNTGIRYTAAEALELNLENLKKGVHPYRECTLSREIKKSPVGLKLPSSNST